MSPLGFPSPDRPGKSESSSRSVIDRRLHLAIVVGVAFGLVFVPAASGAASHAASGSPTCHALPVTRTVKVRTARRFERHFQLPVGAVRWYSPGYYARCSNGRAYAASNFGGTGMHLTDRQSIVFQDGGWLFGGTAASSLRYIGDGADMCAWADDGVSPGTISFALLQVWHCRPVKVPPVGLPRK